MRFVYMIRPGGRALNDGRLRLIVGGMVFVRLGATFRGAGYVRGWVPEGMDGGLID